ncbi:YciI family protein [Flammeovirga sp. SubArs3]|uniref:YciI family protein n=1 Tax=Flammeovirga sp. SubArs3 TaxID=2995316 RepID=UPI00248B9869|nr:YciI family protein [Flammeovirga sp. SubArs3]
MKNNLLLLLLSTFFIGCTTPTSPNNHNDYDASLALKYGADDYGMKKFVMAFLKKGPNRNLSKEEAFQLQKAHLENINKMAEEGKLVLAGPFFGDGDIRGIYIFDVESIEEAEALTKTDPAIQAGSLVMDLKEWYGSAAVMAIPDLHKKLEKKNVTEGER